MSKRKFIKTIESKRLQDIKNGGEKKDQVIKEIYKSKFEFLHIHRRVFDKHTVLGADIEEVMKDAFSDAILKLMENISTGKLKGDNLDTTLEKYTFGIARNFVRREVTKRNNTQPSNLRNNDVIGQSGLLNSDGESSALSIVLITSVVWLNEEELKIVDALIVKSMSFETAFKVLDYKDHRQLSQKKQRVITEKLRGILETILMISKHEKYIQGTLKKEKQEQEQKEKHEFLSKKLKKAIIEKYLNSKNLFEPTIEQIINKSRSKFNNEEIKVIRHFLIARSKFEDSLKDFGFQDLKEFNLYLSRTLEKFYALIRENYHN